MTIRTPITVTCARCACSATVFVEVPAGPAGTPEWHLLWSVANTWATDRGWILGEGDRGNCICDNPKCVSKNVTTLAMCPICVTRMIGPLLVRLGAEGTNIFYVATATKGG